MAAQMAITILIGVFGGIKIDEYLKMQTPIFTLIFSLLAVAAAMYLVIKDINS
jgi:F0F1-type ATP synthase assembly protein I